MKIKDIIKMLEDFAIFFTVFLEDLVLYVFFNKTLWYFIVNSFFFIFFLFLLLDRYFSIFWYEFYYIFFIFYHFDLFEAYHAKLYNIFEGNLLFRFLFCVNVFFFLKNSLVYCIVYGFISINLYDKKNAIKLFFFFFVLSIAFFYFF